jgi:hypothetical protein
VTLRVFENWVMAHDEIGVRRTRITWLRKSDPYQAP